MLFLHYSRLSYLLIKCFLLNNHNISCWENIKIFHFLLDHSMTEILEVKKKHFLLTKFKWNFTAMTICKTLQILFIMNVTFCLQCFGYVFKFHLKLQESVGLCALKSVFRINCNEYTTFSFFFFCLNYTLIVKDESLLFISVASPKWRIFVFNL